MKTSTSFNSMKAIVRLASVLCVLFWGVGNAWGGTYSFDLHTVANKSAGSNVSYWYSNSTCTTNCKTVDGSSYKITSCTLYYKDATITTATPFVINVANDAYWFASNPSKFFIGKSGSTITLPTFSGEKITNVRITTGAQSSTKVTFCIKSGSNNASTNESQTGAASSSFDFPIISTYQNTQLTFTITNANNINITDIIITTEATASCSTNATVSAGSNSSVTSTTATVTCASGISSLGSDGCSISSYGFVLNTTGTPTISDTKHQVGTTYTTTGTSFSKHLTSLTPNTTYYVRPYATNGNGTAYGTQTSFTTLQRYTISYDNNGGSGSMASSTKDHGVSFTLPANAGSMTKTGHHITGWLLGSSSGTHYDLSGSYTINTDAAFYVEWTLNQWTLTWNWGGGSTTSTSYSLYPATSGSVNYGSSITKPANGTMNKTGYDFSGWSSSASTMPDNNLTITAQWTAQKYNITYKDQGGGDYTGSNLASLPAKHTYGSATALVNGAKTGYTFVGWYTDEACTVSAGSSIGATAKTAAFTLYAKWTANTYHVAFNANGGSGSDMSSQDFTYDEAQNLSSNSYTAPTHKYFIGWNTSSGASTALYTDGESVSNLTSTANKTVTLYAIWKDHTYTNYRTMCCTEIAEVDGKIGIGSISETACRASWTLTGENTGIDKFILTVYDAKDNVVKTIDNISASATYTDVSGLTPCTEYYVTLTTVSSGVYCEGAEQGKSDNFTTNAWAVHYDGGDESEGALLSHVTKLTGGAGACTSADYVATFRADIGYDLPTTVSVNIGGYNELTVDEDYSWGIADGVGTLTINTTTIDLNEEIYIRIIGVEVGCLNNPTIGAARLNGSYSLSTVEVSVGTSTTGSAYCAWEDYGFVWSTSSSPALNADGTEPSGVNKEQVGTSGNATTWDGSLTGSFSVGTTYYFRAYGKNSKDGGAYAYSSSDATFTPRRVTFNSNGGSEVSSVILNNGGTVSAPSVPTKTGYTFSKWQLEGADYDFSSAVTGNITLDAVWTANEYEVTLNKQGGTTGTSNVTATYGADMPALPIKPGRAGYTWLGYFASTNGEGTKYYNVDKSSAHVWDQAENATIYAAWTPNNYTITLNNEGADEGYEGTESISVTYDAATNLDGTPAITKPVKTGYVFCGYYTAAGGSGVQIIDENGAVIAQAGGNNTYTNSSKQWKYENSIELHAYWKQIYTVTWQVDGEEWEEGVVDGNTYVISGERVSALPTAPTSSNCDDKKKFVGWRASAIDGTSVSMPSGIFTSQANSPVIANDATFHAVFADVTGGDKITFDLPFDNKSECGVSNYLSTWTAQKDDFTWTISNFNNNNFSSGWTTDIRCGRDGNASIASITTDAAISFRVDSVYINLTATNDSYINSAKLQISSSSGISTPDEINIPVNTTGVKGLKITSPAKDKYYRVIFDCKNTGKSNGYVRIGSIVYKQKLDTANFVTTCAECTAAPTFNTTKAAVSAIGCEGATVTAAGGLATLGTGDGCNIRSYGFVWGTNANPTLEDHTGGDIYTVSENINENVEFSYDITGLSSGTQYYVRAYAVNKSGIAYTLVQPFWTNGVSSITLTQAPRTKYIVGESFDPTGMEVIATMASGEEADITEECTYSTDALEAGTGQEFTISYSPCEEDKTVTQTIDVYTLSISEGTNPTYGDYSVSGNVITVTPESGKIGVLEVTSTAGGIPTAEIQDNNDNTYNIIHPTGNVTIVINYRTAAPTVVHYYVNGVEITSLKGTPTEGSSFDLPASSAVATAIAAQGVTSPNPELYPNFWGWSKTAVHAQSAEPAVLNGSTKVYTETSFHAVYTNMSKIRIDESDITYTAYSAYSSGALSATFGGKSFTYYNILKNSSNLQFKNSSSDYGYIYNSTAISDVKHVDIGASSKEDRVKVFACSAENTISGSAITDADTRRDAYVYIMPANTEYFIVKGDNSATYYIDYIDIYYGTGEEIYTSTFESVFNPTGEWGTWSNAADWADGVLPSIKDEVTITKPMIVDITTAKAKSIVLDQSGGNSGSLNINAGKALVVAETVQTKNASGVLVATSENDINIGSTLSNGTGALIIGDHDGTNKATVNFAVKAKKDGSGHWINQFIGTPFNDENAVLYNYYETQLYEFKADGSGTTTSEWTKLKGSDRMEPFMGYNLLRSKTDNHVLWMQGTLNATNTPVEKHLYYNGSSKTENMLANGWVAPIHIDAFEEADFGGAEAAIYIFNAGTPEDQGSHSTSDGSASNNSPGQYIALPVASTPWVSPTVTVIPAMQAFSVFATGADQTLTLDYDKLVYTPAQTNVGVVPTRAPRRHRGSEAPEVIRMHVNAESGYNANAYVLGRWDFEEGFDNGWDGRFIEGDEEAPQLYMSTIEGKMVINCVPEIDGTVLDFQRGSADAMYTFTFEYEGDKTWYLNDLKEKKSTRISGENNYTFYSENYDSRSRFVISSLPVNTATGVDRTQGDNVAETKARKIMVNGLLYIIRGGQIYDATGAIIK